MNNLLYRIILIFGFISFCTLLLLILCRDSSHFYGFDSKKDSNLLYAIFFRFYFILTTITTVGYGDVSPSSIRAKTFVIVLVFTVIVVILNQIDGLKAFGDKTISMAKNEINTIKKQAKDIKDL